MSNSSVAAVIVTYNNEDTISACAKSLQTRNIKAIVVDNASQDGTIRVIRKNASQVVQNKTNLGFAAAVNIGCKQYIDWEYVLLLNPDAELKSSLDEAVQHFRNHPKTGVIGLGLHDSKTGKLERDSFGAEPTLSNLLQRKISTTENYKLQITNYSLVDWVSGGAMVIRNETFHDVGGFDEDFFLYWEDIDFCHRARKAGWQVLRIPSIHVDHHRGVSLEDKKTKTRLYDTSADRYYQKHYSKALWQIQHFLRRIYRWLSPQVR